ncbi:hypothetical protein LL912_13310 [Niabella sp. CC-SYL272]|uniref:hypothetical protein n=1 Tax=Niabella agricola TaxID=2891571 RepID=UPI001F280E57|nr:hypothetical protein [Niabella agricola]MCF3109753.1 hypothetical protein [Niabella agricola]
MKRKLLLLLLTITGLSMAAGAQGTLYSASGSGNAGATSIDWVLGSLSTDGGPGAIALPVQFGTITASMKNQQLLVQWTTETEMNNDHFDIEVSKDGTLFKKLASVVSKAPEGVSNATLEYQYETGPGELMVVLGLGLLCFTLRVSKNRVQKAIMVFATFVAIAFIASCNKKDFAIKTTNSELYLRITQVDKDGTKAYSKVIKVIQD